MPKSDLTISLNEVLFYFTRAGFGVKAPIGVSEDFARSNIWAAQNGFDPSECSILALDNLDLKKSSLSIKFEKNSKSSHLFCTEEKVLSSLEASVSCVDWIEFNGLDGELKIVNHDGETTISKLTQGNSYFREKGINHNVLNNNDFPYRFVEIEFK